MEFIAIENELIRLLPLQADDFDSLYAVASDSKIWEQHPNRDRYQLDGFTKYFEHLLHGNIPYLIIDKNTQDIIGATSYYQYSESENNVAIGFTFLARKYWGNGYNKSLKHLMLTHAFQFVDEVIFHVQYKNLRSQSALQKIGATKRKEFTDPANPDSVKYEYVIYKKDFRH